MRIKLSKILCATDFSPSARDALSYAIALARAYEAKLVVCHAIDLSAAGLYDMSAFVLRETREKLFGNAREEIDRLMAGRQVQWEPLIIEGLASLELPRIAKENGVDLVVTGTHGRSGVKRVLLGSVAERLQRTLPCPFLAVRGAEGGAPAVVGDAIHLRKILVGCDFSPDSALAIQYALSLAQELEADVHLVNVIEPWYHEHLTSEPVGLAEELKQAVRQTVERKLSHLAGSEVRAWCDVTTSLRTGRPDDEIVKYAGEVHADLIVLGLRGHGLVEELFVGSTADHVLRKAPCPVMTVRSATKN